MMLLKLSFCFLVLNLVLVSCNDNTKDTKMLEENCTPVPSLRISNRTQELYCCAVVLRNLYKRWARQDVYLSTTLAAMQAWNCPQFKNVCVNRTLAFTKFTSLMYDRFCNQSKLVSECGNTVEEAIGESEHSALLNKDAGKVWKSLASGIVSSELSTAQLEDPCIQVALYDSPTGGNRNYHETIIYIIPYCPSAWCGYDASTYTTMGINGWACLPTRCRANIVILITLFIILAIVITFANLTVIAVYGSEEKARHSQGIFRISLGVADALVGLFVFPSAAAMMYRIYFHNVKFQSPVNISTTVNDSSVNGTWNLRTDTVSVSKLESRVQAFDENLPESFVDVVGFVTTLSLTVSIYLLTASGIDRLQAITRPVAYRQHNAKQFALICSGVTWMLAILISAVPFFSDELRYTITGSGFVTLFGDSSLILYIAGFFIPLLVTWAISIAMYGQGKKSFQRRSTISNARRQHIKQQRTLNKVLTLMVTAFSLSLAPTVLVLIIVIFIPGTNPSRPLSYDATLNSVANSLELTATFILLCNSLWNCMIYSIRNKTFRNNAKDTYLRAWNVINPFNWCKVMRKWRTMCTGEAYPHHQMLRRRPTSSFNTSIRFISTTSQMSKKHKERAASITHTGTCHSKTCQNKCEGRKASVQSKCSAV